MAKLPNYLRSHRRRLRLSQDEVSFLLGVETGEMVCRHEQFGRNPSLLTAMAYEAIFDRPIRELFAGLYEKIQTDVANRAISLGRRLEWSGGRVTSREIQPTLDRMSGVKGESIK